MELLMSRVPDPAAPLEPLEIETLIRRTLAGDALAFEHLIMRYERRVLTLAMRFLRRMDDAQDAAQEVFLRAYKYIHRLDSAKPIEPWLVRITVNVCRDIGRKRQRQWHTFTDMTDVENTCGGASANPHTELAQEQQRRMLWRALDTLPEKERMALILRDVEGFSTSEVATILESSEATVRSQICRGRLKIREAMDHMTRGDQ